MKRRSRAASGRVKTRGRKPAKLKPRHALKAASGRSSAGSQQIEVARLTRGRDEALQQQAATSEVLRIIRRSPADAQPVFDAIVESAARLSGAIFSSLYLYDGERMRIGATSNISIEATSRIQEIQQLKRPERSHLAGRAILERAIVHVHDVLADPEYSRELALAGGWRAVLAVPLVRDGIPVGALSVAKTEPTPFSNRQVQLLQTFADQAVIAIENTRLLNELRQRTTDLTERTADLTESLEQQKATSEVLQVISSSPGRLETVFQAMAEKAVRVCGATFGSIYARSSSLSIDSRARGRERDPLGPPPARRRRFHFRSIRFGAAAIAASVSGATRSGRLGGAAAADRRRWRQWVPPINRSQRDHPKRWSSGARSER
jgi:hypothetical protein